MIHFFGGCFVHKKKSSRNNNGLTRENRQKCMVYPEDKFKEYWDGINSLVLILTCFVTPIRLAFYSHDELIWYIINYMIDFLFLADIIIIFNTAYYDDDFHLIENKRQIATFYLKGWFVVDVLSIFPLAEIAKLVGPTEQEASPEEFN